MGKIYDKKKKIKNSCSKTPHINVRIDKITDTYSQLHNNIRSMSNFVISLAKKIVTKNRLSIKCKLHSIK